MGFMMMFLELLAVIAMANGYRLPWSADEAPVDDNEICWKGKKMVYYEKGFCAGDNTQWKYIRTDINKERYCVEECVKDPQCTFVGYREINFGLAKRKYTVSFCRKYTSETCELKRRNSDFDKATYKTFIKKGCQYFDLLSMTSLITEYCAENKDGFYLSANCQVYANSLFEKCGMLPFDYHKMERTQECYNFKEKMTNIFDQFQDDCRKDWFDPHTSSEEKEEFMKCFMKKFNETFESVQRRRSSSPYWNYPQRRSSYKWE